MELLQADSQASVMDIGTVGKCPVVTVNMGGVDVSCLLDTGCQVSTVTESIFRQNIAPDDSELASCHWLKLTAANGLAIPYIGYIELDVEFFGRTIPARGILVAYDSPDAEQRSPKDKCPEILGMNVLGSFDITLGPREDPGSTNDHTDKLCCKGFVKVAGRHAIRVPVESCKAVSVSGLQSQPDGTPVIVESIKGSLPGDVSVCSTLTRAQRGTVAVQVMNSSREDVWLDARLRIGLYQV